MTPMERKRKLNRKLFIIICIFSIMGGSLLIYQAAYKVYINYVTREQFTELSDSKINDSFDLSQPPSNTIKDILGVDLIIRLNSGDMRCYSISNTECVLIFSRIAKNVEANNIKKTIECSFLPDGINSLNGEFQELQPNDSSKYRYLYEYTTEADQIILMGYYYNTDNNCLYGYTFSGYEDDYKRF